MNEEKLREIMWRFHVRAFGEEMARVNFASREERWAYVHRLWARIRERRRRDSEMRSS